MLKLPWAPVLYRTGAEHGCGSTRNWGPAGGADTVRGCGYTGTKNLSLAQPTPVRVMERSRDKLLNNGTSCIEVSGERVDKQYNIVQFSLVQKLKCVFKH